MKNRTLRNIILTAGVVVFSLNSLVAQTIDVSRPVGTTDGSGSVNSTGGSSYTIPLKLPAGTGAMTPNVSLVYNSQSAEGIAGLGWSLSCMSSITRAGRNNYYNGIAAPVKYTNTNDAFVLDGQRMFVTSGTNGANGAVYGLENEVFTKIESFGGSETAGPAWFRVTSKNGVVMEYGNATGAKMNTDDGASTMVWLLNKVTDINGNYQTYSYTVNTSMRTYLLNEIAYTGNTTQGLLPYNKVIFYYGIRSDWENTVVYEAGATMRKAWGLMRVDVQNASLQTLRSYDFNYSYKRGLYYLNTITEKGADGTALNPMVFTYGADTTAPDVQTTIEYSNMHQGNVYAGDFNGDSKQDVLSVNYSIDNNGIRRDLSYDVLSNFSSYLGQPAINFFYNYQVPAGTTVKVNSTPNAYLNYLTNDYDGDGKEDVLMVNNQISGNDVIFNGVRINYSRYYSVYSGPSYDSVSYLSLPHSWLYVQDFRYTYRNGSTLGRNFVAGDFDGDGVQDYILILGINSSNAFKAFFSSPKKGILNEEIIGFGVEGNANDAFYANSVASANQLIPFDFDGDGKQEILVVKGTQSYVLSVNPLPSSTGYMFGGSILHTFTDIKSDNPVFPGDFNGDGKIDLLYRAGNTDVYANWYILTSTGKSFVSKQYIYPNRIYLPQDNGGSAHHLMVADFNGDGKTDIWHSLDLSGVSSKHNLGYSNGQNFVWDIYYTPVSINGSVTANTVIGDFNGDGKPDILGINAASKGKFIYAKPGREDNLLRKVVNGLGAVEGFNYSLLNSSYGLYSRSWYYEYDQPGLLVGTGVNGNPYNVLLSPLYVVGETYRSNGLGTNQNGTGYTYKDAAFSRRRGFIGFRSYTSQDYATGVLSGVENTIDADLLVARPVHQYAYRYPDTLTDTKTIDTLQKATFSYLDKRYVHKVLKATSYDGLTGMATQVENTYDNYGNITSNNSKKGYLSGNTFVALETGTNTTVYGIHGTPVPAVPESVIVTNTRSGQSTVTKKSISTYTTAGLLQSTTDFAETPIAVTTSYTYDGFGNIKTIGTNAPGTVTPTVTNFYDNTGRFLIRKDISGSGITKTEIKTYDPKWGALASVVSSDGLTTSYVYNSSFGRSIQVTLPDGNIVNQSIQWETDGNAVYSATAQRQADGGSYTKEYYDRLDRKVKDIKGGFNGQELTATISYNNKGQIQSETDHRYTGEAAVTTTNSFDNYGRLTGVSNGSTSTTYTYTRLASGQYSITTTNGSSQASVKTQDGVGRIISAGDNGGQLSFTYDSWGNQKNVSLGGNVLVSNQYDSYGRKISASDINGGTLSYEYNSWGQVTKETNALGQIHTAEFDAFKRQVSRTGPEGTVSYTYYNDPSTGKCNDNIAQINGFSGDVSTFQYNALGRPVSQTTVFDGNTFTKTMEYDSYGNLIKTTYPSGVVINDTYDKNGILTRTTLGSGSTQQMLFQASALNSKGVYTGYSYGNGLTSSLEYDLLKGVPTRYYTQGVQDLRLNFDGHTGNLISREDALKGLTETFGFDNLNRLTTTGINNTPQLSMTYDAANNVSLGNITSKSDVGNFVYDNSRVNAVSYITSAQGGLTAPGVIPQNQQNVVYAPFQKVQSVTENNYQLSYIYGQDHQRLKSELKLNNALVESKYYLGAFERYTKNGVTKDIHFVNAGNGLCAVVVKEGGNITSYFVYYDHLGSLLTLTDFAGNIIAKQSFDAWGRNRNADNWSYTNVAATPDWLYRGYTGHEHMPQSGLVNMNGRLYDPATGRMLSPDNFIPGIWNTQAYNGYAYVGNNPLSFNDPDGEFLNFIVGALIGGTINVLSGILTGKINNFGDGLKYFGIGALAGAVGAGIGAGVSSAIGGGSFGAGFVGSTAAKVAGTSFINGAIIGGASGFAGGLVGGMGNGLIEGQGFGKAFSTGLKTGMIGALSGGLIEGTLQGINALADGRRFFDGATVEREVLANQQIPQVTQSGNNNCLPASGEAVDKSYGGTLDQVKLRNQIAPGTNPATDPINVGDFWGTNSGGGTSYASLSGRTVTVSPNYIATGTGTPQVSLGDITKAMSGGSRVALNLTNAGTNVGHSVVLKSVVSKFITKLNGSTVFKVIFKAMDPFRGFVTYTTSGGNYIPSNVNHVFFIR